MWCVLSDNLSAVQILELCKNPKRKVDKNDFYLQKYLYALILWDAIYTAPRKSNSRKIYTEADKKQKENELTKTVKKTFFDLPFKFSPDDIEILAGDLFGDYWYKNGEDKNSIQDALFYMALGQLANMNTLLSEQRACFVEKSGLQNKMWSREDVLKYIDREVFEIYKKVNDIWGKDIRRIQTPLLIDYICDNATCLQDAINIALQLREQRDVIEFRQTMVLCQYLVQIKMRSSAC